jgi:two-component system response regulator YesN
MFHVLIADDERKICQLIQCLVDWEAMETEIVACVHNGEDALKIVEKQKIDILITDIRMPKYGGLELLKKVKDISPDTAAIIVSGHRQFEYAHAAIQYGAEEYLLKPIRKDELQSAVQKVLEKRRVRIVEEEERNKIKERMIEDEKRFRSLLVRDYIEHEGAGELPCSLEDIRGKYHCDFGFQFFVAAVLKVDFLGKVDGIDIEMILRRKIGRIIENNIKEENLIYCYEIIHNDICFLINFDLSAQEKLYGDLWHVIYEIKSLSDSATSLHATVALGSIVDDIARIRESVHTAKVTIADRLLRGVDQIIEDMAQNEALSAKDMISDASRQVLLGRSGFPGTDALVQAVAEIQSTVDGAPNKSGALILSVCEEAFEYFMVGIKPFFSQNEIEDIKDGYKRGADMSISEEQAFQNLRRHMADVLWVVQEKRSQKEKKPIIEAKSYIQDNYREQISLEDVSNYVGFNAAYFSYLFKREVGRSFLEYLTDVRMQEAKHLLSDSTRSIGEIAERVGYIDSKYFSRAFKKIMGISPSQYRALY